MPALRLCLIDMNNGVKNEAMRCFRTIVERFVETARASNPGLETALSHVQPRNLGEAPPAACDLYLSTGGPGSPFDGYDDPWCSTYRRFLDGVADENDKGRDDARSVLAICHSFELAIQHFGFAKMAKRPIRKFGVQPVYVTPRGMESPLFTGFGDRLFAWEHRDWEAVDLDEKKLAAQKGELWAIESRDGKSKGEGLLAFRFVPGIVGTQFHPEADREGAMAWLVRPEQEAACIAAYGEVTYKRMRKTVDDPTRLARTFTKFIPGWLTRRFNALAPSRGWTAIASAA